MKPSGTGVYRFGQHTLEVAEHRLKRGETEISLQPKAFETLVYLVERRGHLVKKNELLDAVWAGVAVTEGALSLRIKEIRQALEDDAKRPRYIRTIPTVGYKFIADVEQITDTDGLRESRAGDIREQPGKPNEVIVAAEPSRVASERNLTERPVVPESPVRRQKHWVATVLAVTALAALTGLLAMLNWRETGELRVEQTRQVTFAPELELDPAISPDGKMVAYVLDSGTRMDIYIRSLAGGEPTNLTKDLLTIAHRWPQWSPDGTEIAFLSTSSGQRLATFATTEHTIQVVRLPGGAPRTITNASMRGLDWSPDGTKIAFVRDSDIYVISAAGTGLRRIAEGYEAHALSWSPDGKWIAYVCGNVLSLFGPNMFGNLAPSFIAIASADGGESRQLTDSRTTNTSPVWMPDSRSLLFLSNRGGSRDVFHVRLSDTAEALAEPRRITTGLNALSIHLSRDGRQLAYSLFLSKANLWSLALPESGPVSPAEAKPVTTGAQSIEGVSITRDGKWIAFDSNRSGNQDIYRIPREGGQPEQLTTDPSDDFLPAWSRDGHSIAFHSFRNGNRDIYVMSADGTGQQQVTSDPAQERYPQWSPDGRSLTFFSDKTRRQEIYTVTRENGGWGQPRQLTSSEGAQVPRWSPDGESIAYIDLVKGLSVISPTGRTLRHLVNVRPPFDPKFVAWSGDSKTIYYKAGTLRGSFWSVPASGGSPTQLVQFDDARNFARIEFDLLEKELFFTMTQRESDIWILELHSQASAHFSGDSPPFREAQLSSQVSPREPLEFPKHQRP